MSVRVCLPECEVAVSSEKPIHPPSLTHPVRSPEGFRRRSYPITTETQPGSNAEKQSRITQNATPNSRQHIAHPSELAKTANAANPLTVVTQAGMPLVQRDRDTECKDTLKENRTRKFQAVFVIVCLTVMKFVLWFSGLGISWKCFLSSSPTPLLSSCLVFPRFSFFPSSPSPLFSIRVMVRLWDVNGQ